MRPRAARSVGNPRRVEGTRGTLRHDDDAAMGMTVQESLGDIGAWFEAELERCLAGLCRSLERIGLKTVAYARSRPMAESWIDRTGNLRSSIGYCVVRDGRLTGMSGFSPVGPSASEGPEEGTEFIRSLASELSDGGIFLIIVAGMEYALYVEGRPNKDVLKSAERLLRDEIKKLCEDVGI